MEDNKYYLNGRSHLTAHEYIDRERSYSDELVHPSKNNTKHSLNGYRDTDVDEFDLGYSENRKYQRQGHKNLDTVIFRNPEDDKFDLENTRIFPPREYRHFVTDGHDLDERKITKPHPKEHRNFNVDLNKERNCLEEIVHHTRNRRLQPQGIRNSNSDDFNFVPRSGRLENHLNSENKYFQKPQERKRSERNLVKKLFHQDLLRLNYRDLDDSDSFRHLKCGFVDENDFDEFKQDLIDIRKLRKEFDEDLDPRLLRNISTDFYIKSRHKFSKTADKRKSRLNSVDPNPIMEFFQTDEHFKEFDRVFETFKSNRFSDNYEKLRLSLNRYGQDDDDDEDEDIHHSYHDKYESTDDNLDDPFEDSRFDDTFTDFFDNDEDFKDFERELQNFTPRRRRSQIIDRLNRNSGCDIVVELKAFCDKDPTEKYDAMSNEPRLWNSGGEWDFIFNKIKRDSRTFSDTSGTGRSITSIFEDKEASYDTGFYSDDKDKEINCSKTSDATSSNDVCQFTCHQKCGPLVRLGCKCRSPTGSVGGLATDPLSAETSLSEDLDASLTISADGSSEPTNEKDETDSGYRSGTIPDEKLPKKPSQATLNREELKKKIDEYNSLVPFAELSLKEEKGESFQGFIKVVLNLVRPICMSLGMRPPSIYQALTREHIIEQNTQTVSFYMPRDTVKAIHVHSDTTTKEVIAMLLQKFHILDNPRKFALYEQQLNVKGKITKLRRLNDKEIPLSVCLEWENEKIPHSRLVIQENETGEIMWEAFSTPELNNFLRVLDREEGELISQLEYKYKVMKKIIHQRMKELRREKHKEQVAKRESMHERLYDPDQHWRAPADSGVN